MIDAQDYPTNSRTIKEFTYLQVTKEVIYTSAVAINSLKTIPLNRKTFIN